MPGILDKDLNFDLGQKVVQKDLNFLFLILDIQLYEIWQLLDEKGVIRGNFKATQLGNAI